MKDDIIASDQSQTHRTYLCIYGTVGICLFGYIIMTIRYIINTHQFPWLDVITEIIILLALLAVAMTRSSYELHEKDILITTSNPFRTRTFRIPYSEIDGVHHFKVEPIKSISYRHTYRMYGSMDRRDVWSLVYNIPETDKVARILMKASDEFWTAFEKLLPGRIRVPQEEVLKLAFRHISGIDSKKTKNRAKKAAAEDVILEAEEAAQEKSDKTEAPINTSPDKENTTPAETASLKDIAAELRKDNTDKN